MSKNIDKVIEKIRDEMGQDIIVEVNKERVDVPAISTGSFSLDIALGVGGVPKGRVVEIFGQESTGKTTLALNIAREGQKEKRVAFIDAENALDLEYARNIGVDTDNLIISQPDSAEQGLQLLEKLVKSNEFSVIIIDSVAAMSPRAEIEGEIGDATIGLQARLMSSALRKLSKPISESGTVVVFLNQVRQKIGGYGSSEVTSGGLALKFYCSVRINLRKGGRLKSKDVEIGERIKATVVKNKVAPPFRTAEYDVYYGEGISRSADILNAAVKVKLVKKSGAWLSYGEAKGAGFEGLKKILDKDPELLEEIRLKVLEIIQNGKKEKNREATD